MLKLADRHDSGSCALYRAWRFKSSLRHKIMKSDLLALSPIQGGKVNPNLMYNNQIRIDQIIIVTLTLIVILLVVGAIFSIIRKR